MKILKSPSAIDEQLKQSTEDCTKQVKAIRAAQDAKAQEVAAEVQRIGHQLESMLLGATPADAIDVRALRKFLGKREAPSDSNIEPVRSAG